MKKRASTICYALPFGQLPLPDGVVDSGDRATIARMYSFGNVFQLILVGSLSFGGSPTNLLLDLFVYLIGSFRAGVDLIGSFVAGINLEGDV